MARSSKHLLIVFSAALLLVGAVPGCTLVADLDRYVSADDLGCDVVMQVHEFTPHLNDAVYFQVVTRDSDTLRAVAIIDPLVDANRSFTMPNAVGEGAHALQFWADVDGNGSVQTSPFNGPDHSWRLPDVCDWVSTCTAGGESNCFSHVAPFDNVMDPNEEGHSVVLALSAIPATAGFIEVHVVEIDSGRGLRRVVGLYRRDVLNGVETFDVTLSGLALAGRRYTTDVLLDLDGDGSIDGTREVFSITESDGSAYASVVNLDVSSFDPAGALPVEGVLVSPLAAP